jgi:NDP-sugar pyrophosphorylase family protein
MEFPSTGYVNPLADARDLRQFAVDILTLRTVTKPAGQQSRPGVWIGAGAVLENGSRIVAPAFVGSSARIRAGALVTRCTAIEHHAEVDCGTVVENSTVLPHSYVGAGLDLAHCVAGMGQIVNLRRNATVTVADPTLLGQADGSGDWLERVVARLSSLLPESLRGRLDRRAGTLQPKLESALIPKVPKWGESVVAPGTLQENGSAGEYSSSLVVARRYGDR